MEIVDLAVVGPPSPHSGREEDVIKAQDVGHRLSVIREAFGLKPSEAADLLGIDRSAWTRFEKGKRIIPYDKAFLLVDRFGVSLDYIILGRSDQLSFEVREKLREAEARLSQS